MAHAYPAAATPLTLTAPALVDRRARLVRFLPLGIVMAYLLTVFGLFLVWPINWPIYRAAQWVSLIGYVLLCFGVIAWTFALGTRRNPVAFVPFRFLGLVILAGAMASFVLLFPTSIIYTGRWPWQVAGALGDQGEAYRSLQLQLELTAGQRGPIAFARALAAPLTFAVLPFGIIYWTRLTWTLRGAVLLAAACTVILSLLRGTDREFGDLFIVGGSALLISLARQVGAGERLALLVRRYWKPAIAVLVFVAIAFTLSTQRKNARLGGFEERQVLCANNTNICADIDQPVLRHIPLSQRVGISFFILSTSSGFYGLALALEKDFRPTWGVGHSPAALSVYELLTGDERIEGRTFTDRNGFDGWPDENFWSTLVTWIANDVGFPGAVLVLALIGFAWGRGWRDATHGGSDPAAIIFCQLMIMMFYLPANNQVYAIYDGYTVTAVWAVLWQLGKRRLATGGGASA